STDGITWTTVARSAMTISLPAPVQAGLAVTSHNTGVLSQVVFKAVTQGSTASEPPDVCPGAYSCADIGGATPAGSEALLNGGWTVTGGGGDIWGTADQFRYLWRSLAGDGT